MAAKLTKATGYFIVVYGEGYIWPETLSRRAQDCRRIMGDIMVGIKRADTMEAGWRYALSRGYRVEKVDVFPAGRVQSFPDAGRQALSLKPEDGR